MSWPIRMTVMIAAMVLPIAIYVGMRTYAALRDSEIFQGKKAKFTVIGVLFWVFLLPISYGIFGYTTFYNLVYTNEPGLGLWDYLVLFPAWVGFVIILETFTFYVIIDIGNLIGRAMNRRKTASWTKNQAYAKLIVLVVIAGLSGYNIYSDTNHVRTNVVHIKNQALQEAFSGLKIALFADVQIDRYTQEAKLSQFSAILEEQQPDLSLFAGDMVTSGTKYTKQAIELVSKVPAKIAHVGVFGDHDFWSDPERIPAGFRTNGWQFLENEHQIIVYNGKRILITGITQIYSRRISREDVRVLLSSAPEADMKIVLSHQPAKHVAREAAAAGYDLLLAGHTHGGQFVTHFFGYGLTPSRFETPYFRGQSMLDNLEIIVTNGIGLTLAPIRYSAPAEVTILAF